MPAESATAMPRCSGLSRIAVVNKKERTMSALYEPTSPIGDQPIS